MAWGFWDRWRCWWTAGEVLGRGGQAGGAPLRVLISYAHDDQAHKDKVRDFPGHRISARRRPGSQRATGVTERPDLHGRLIHRRSCVWRSNHASGERLRRILDRAVAWCRTGLRSDRVHAKRPEDPALSGQRPPQPARAVPAQVKLAGPVYPVRRADRRPAPITRLIHLAPPAQVPARCPILIAHHFTSAFPARPLVRPSGTATRSRAGSRGAGHRRRARATQRYQRPARPAPGAGRTTRAPSASLPTPVQSHRPPARYRPALNRSPLSPTAGTSKRTPAGQVERRHPHPDDSHHRGRCGYPARDGEPRATGIAVPGPSATTCPVAALRCAASSTSRPATASHGSTGTAPRPRTALANDV